MKIELFPYNPQWPIQFDQEKVLLNQILKDLFPDISHIGSTAVLGLGAKPIIDILIGLSKSNDLDLAAKLLAQEGYIYFKKWEAMLPERRFLVKVKDREKFPKSPLLIDIGEESPIVIDQVKTHHIHVCEKNSEFWKRHIQFRNYLRKHDDVKEQYHQLKINLSQREWSSGSEYADHKSDFIRTIEAKAQREDLG